MCKKSMLTTGEFARLCKTTKQTLFHYDKENLLKPRYVSENGYRRYGVEQFFDFDMIGMLKDTGSTLKEIRGYMRGLNAGDFLATLEAKRLVAKKERERLAQREQKLQDMAVLTREALALSYDTFMVELQQEERLEVFPVETAPLAGMPDIVKSFAEYLDFYEKRETMPRFPFGIIVNHEDVTRGLYAERYYFGRAIRGTPRSMLHIKPAGRYAVLAHKGTVQTHQEAFIGLLRQIKDAGLSAAGDAYAYDLMSYILQGAGGKRYAAKYCVLVE